jgi:hypothetical protein
MFSLTERGLHMLSLCLATESHFVSLMQSQEKQSFGLNKKNGPTRRLL